MLLAATRAAAKACCSSRTHEIVANRATECAWFSTFFEKAFVSRMNRRVCMRMPSLAGDGKSHRAAALTNAEPAPRPCRAVRNSARIGGLDRDLVRTLVRALRETVPDALPRCTPGTVSVSE